jgi:hypothetical protein
MIGAGDTMKKDFDEFVEILESDTYRKGIGALKHMYLDDESMDIEDRIVAYEKQKELLRLRTYHEWLTSDID